MIFRRRRPVRRCRHWWQQRVTPEQLSTQLHYPHAKRCRRCGALELWARAGYWVITPPLLMLHRASFGELENALSRMSKERAVFLPAITAHPVPVGPLAKWLVDKGLCSRRNSLEMARDLSDEMHARAHGVVSTKQEAEQSDNPLSEAIEITGALWAKRLEDEDDE